MNRVRQLAPLGALALSLMPVETAESAPGFPFFMDVEYCWDDTCYDMIVSIDGDGTFVDSDGDGGIWFYRPAERDMLLRYEGDAAGVDFYGFRTGDCFAGTTFFEEAPDAEWVGCRI